MEEEERKEVLQPNLAHFIIILLQCIEYKDPLCFFGDFIGTSASVSWDSRPVFLGRGWTVIHPGNGRTNVSARAEVSERGRYVSS